MVGPAQLLRAEYMLLFAGHAAGLEVETRSCRALVLFQPSADVLRVLAGLPVPSQPLRDSTRVHGLPPDLLLDILGPAVQDYALDERPCSCRLKTAVVAAAASRMM